MKRRNFMKLFGATGLMGVLPGVGVSNLMAETIDPSYTGDFLFTIDASGGLYQGAFCDPKEGARWGHGNFGTTQTAGKAGGIAFAAPAGENREFFEKYHQDMLVINGIKWASNGHASAGFDQQSASTSSGFPSISAIYSKIKGAGMPMPWLVSSGGGHASAGIQPYTTLPNKELLTILANGGSGYLPDQDMEILASFQNERSDALLAKNTLLPFAKERIRQLQYSRNNRKLLKSIADIMQGDLDTNDLKGESSREVSKIHQILNTMKVGGCVSGYAKVGRFDTHGITDDTAHENFIHLTRTIDYLWTKAEALGIADRLIVHVASDVGRKLNGSNHSTVGSTIIMGKNRSWTNRTVGMSSSTAQAVKINPQTLQEDPEGEQLRSGHVHVALRKILGIEEHPVAQLYALRGVSDIDLLDPNLSSPTFI